MVLKFHKFHGSGNDFILLNNMHGSIDYSGNNGSDMIKGLCNRRFGIGADGLILLEASDSHDFRMVYFNADGNEGSFCGNGSRCAVIFARMQGIIKGATAHFTAADGTHKAKILQKTATGFMVCVEMKDTAHPEKMEDSVYYIDTGSPHLVIFRENVSMIDVAGEGSAIRHHAKWMPGGINVNFAESDEDGGIRIRTFERGVENETLSCGTGVTATALATWVHFRGNAGEQVYSIQTAGGILQVRFVPPVEGASPARFTSVYLEGPAEQVFEGTIKLQQP
ncbi:MAG: diaminopimelate epimerase [Bacteroidia bacterium]|nr:MAG: diaminopimelate epimerase [Bacteroidia bacterium]